MKPEMDELVPVPDSLMHCFQLESYLRNMRSHISRRLNELQQSVNIVWDEVRRNATPCSDGHQLRSATSQPRNFPSRTQHDVEQTTPTPVLNRTSSALTSSACSLPQTDNRMLPTEQFSWDTSGTNVMSTFGREYGDDARDESALDSQTSVSERPGTKASTIAASEGSMDTAQVVDEMIKNAVDMLQNTSDMLRNNEEILKKAGEMPKSTEETLKMNEEVLKKDEEVLKQNVDVLTSYEETPRDKEEILKSGVEMLKCNVDMLKSNLSMLRHNADMLTNVEETLRGRDEVPNDDKKEEEESLVVEETPKQQKDDGDDVPKIHEERLTPEVGMIKYFHQDTDARRSSDGSLRSSEGIGKGRRAIKKDRSVVVGKRLCKGLKDLPVRIGAAHKQTVEFPQKDGSSLDMEGEGSGKVEEVPKETEEDEDEYEDDKEPKEVAFKETVDVLKVSEDVPEDKDDVKPATVEADITGEGAEETKQSEDIPKGNAREDSEEDKKTYPLREEVLEDAGNKGITVNDAVGGSKSLLEIDEERFRRNEEMHQKNEKLHQKNEEMQQKNEEMQRKNEDMLRRNEEILQRNEEMLRRNEELLKKKMRALKNREMRKATEIQKVIKAPRGDYKTTRLRQSPHPPRATSRLSSTGEIEGRVGREDPTMIFPSPPRARSVETAAILVDMRKMLREEIAVSLDEACSTITTKAREAAASVRQEILTELRDGCGEVSTPTYSVVRPGSTPKFAADEGERQQAFATESETMQQEFHSTQETALEKKLMEHIYDLQERLALYEAERTEFRNIIRVLVQAHTKNSGSPNAALDCTAASSGPEPPSFVTEVAAVDPRKLYKLKNEPISLSSQIPTLHHPLRCDRVSTGTETTLGSRLMRQKLQADTHDQQPWSQRGLGLSRAETGRGIQNNLRQGPSRVQGGLPKLKNNVVETETVRYNTSLDYTPSRYNRRQVESFPPLPYERTRPSGTHTGS